MMLLVTRGSSPPSILTTVGEWVTVSPSCVPGTCTPRLRRRGPAGLFRTSNAVPLHGDVNVVDVHSCLTVHEQRRERKQLYVGRQFHRLERFENEWEYSLPPSFCS